MMYLLAESVDVFVEEKVGVLASAIALYSKCYQRYAPAVLLRDMFTQENPLHWLYF